MSKKELKKNPHMHLPCLDEVLLREDVHEFLDWEVEERPLQKGIFWLRDMENFTDCVILTIPINANGEVLEDPELPLNSKNKDNYNHKLTWEQLEKKDTNNKPFNYYPRGRVEVKNGKATIYASPYICGERLLKWCVEMFALKEYNGINDVICRADHSEHYKCVLDD